METIATVLATLPHHSKCGLETPTEARIWEGKFGGRFQTQLLTEVIDHLVAANGMLKGIEWGDHRARHINSSWAGFLQYVVWRRGQAA